MADINAKEVLVGTDAKVFLNGEEWGTFTACEINITYNYDDISAEMLIDKRHQDKAKEH